MKYLYVQKYIYTYKLNNNTTPTARTSLQHPRHAISLLINDAPASFINLNANLA